MAEAQSKEVPKTDEAAPVQEAPAAPAAAGAGSTDTETAKETKPAAAKPAKADAAKSEPKSYVVTGAAVVLPTESGSERYLYKGATVGAGFTKEGIKHAIAVGLIAKAQ